MLRNNMYPVSLHDALPILGQLGMNVERLVAGQGPRRGGPDYGVARLFDWVIECFSELFRLSERKTHIHGRILALLVFDFGLGQRRAAIDAPVDGLQAAIDVALLEQL